eukprot:TRINITY_DN22576_c0_g1_i1.p2 TRINITY_DN22576_c0_g1~~TRINITY_DN22576_c0_g1_i1.p2  ORF type:complete len:116 (-),score=35.16 TRINITY_DN22576_c0_g1_i1:148-495(-)
MSSKKANAKKLLDPSGDFTEDAIKLFQEIFDRFDEDKDGFLNEKELDAFAIACNGEKFTAETKKEIIESFDVNSKDELSKKGFIELFHLQTQGDKNETWRDIQKLGYNRNFERST